MTQSLKEKLNSNKIAELFHDTYETLAPAYGYETREDTKEFDPESKNGKLMIAVCKFVISWYNEQLVEDLEGIDKFTPTDMGVKNEDYIIIRKADLSNLISKLKNNL